MYKFKTERKSDYLRGRTITYLADIIGIAREYMTSILTGKRNCSKMVAYCIVKVGNKESEIKDYFDIIKK